MAAERIPCTVEEAIQALSNAHYKPAWNWHEPSPAPRQKHNSLWPLSIWVSQSVENYHRLVAQFLEESEYYQLNAPQKRAIYWLTENVPSEETAREFERVADYYGGSYHGALIQAHQFALENAHSIQGWLKRKATLYDHQKHLDYVQTLDEYHQKRRQFKLDRAARIAVKRAERARIVTTA